MIDTPPLCIWIGCFDSAEYAAVKDSTAAHFDYKDERCIE